MREVTREDIKREKFLREQFDEYFEWNKKKGNHLSADAPPELNPIFEEWKELKEYIEEYYKQKFPDVV